MPAGNDPAWRINSRWPTYLRFEHGDGRRGGLPASWAFTERPSPAMRGEKRRGAKTGQSAHRVRPAFLRPPGTGKSFLSQALVYEAIEAGHVVLYRSIFDLVRDFLHDEAMSGQGKVLLRDLKPHLLILDDMGLKRLPKQSGDYLLEVILRLHELRATIMISNRPLDDWGKLIGDVPSATAILDRFLHHAEVIQITGLSYRLRDRAGTAGP